MTVEAPRSRRYGKITDEGIAAVRSQIGIPVLENVEADRIFWTQINEDNVRVFATAIGDANPFFVEPGYATKTRWGRPTAPGTIMLQALSVTREGRPYTEAEALARRGAGLAGVQGYYAGTDYEFYLPIQEGDRFWGVSYLADVQEKMGRFAGRELLQTREQIIRNQNGEVVAKLVSSVMNAEREAGAKTKKYDFEPTVWTAEELAKIDEIYEQETYRGAEPRYWEDVEVGTELPPIVRGPYTVTDAIAWRVGNGFGAFVRSGKSGYNYRKAHANAFIPNYLNIPDVPMRAHWENEYAKQIGVPALYDFGMQRIAWMGTLLTNWMGDDGFLKRIWGQIRRFGIEGDVQIIRGRVVDKGVTDNECWVDVEMYAENQRNEVTAPGSGRVLLPSRQHGPVKLPTSGQPPYPTWDGPEGRVTPLVGR